MDTMIPPGNTNNRPQHKRTTSSVLRSMMSPKRNTPAGMGSAGLKSENMSPNKLAAIGQLPNLPPDHPQARYHLREQNGNTDNIHPPPRESIDIHNDNVKSTGLRKRTKSSVSLKSLVSTEKVKTSKPRSPEKEEAIAIKKSKSSTSLSALLSRPKSSKGYRPEDSPRKKDKENRTPPNSAHAAPPPIWAQFATQLMQEPNTTTTTKVPLNDRKNFADEIALYTPRDYSPSKQRNFHDYEQPTLSRQAEPKSRPKSALIPSGPSTSSFAGTLAGLRKPSIEKTRRWPNNDGSNRSSSSETKSSSRRSSLELYNTSEDRSTSGVRMNKRGSRVMAAVAAFNGKSGVPTQEPTQEVQEVKLDVKAIENAFESLLVRILISHAFHVSLISDVLLGLAKRSAAYTRQDEISRYEHKSRLYQAR